MCACLNEAEETVTHIIADGTIPKGNTPGTGQIKHTVAVTVSHGTILKNAFITVV